MSGGSGLDRTDIDNMCHGNADRKKKIRVNRGGNCRELDIESYVRFAKEGLELTVEQLQMRKYLLGFAYLEIY